MLLIRYRQFTEIAEKNEMKGCENMIKELLIQEIIPLVFYAVISTAASVATYELKKFIAARQDLIEKERAKLIQAIGIEKYNHDIQIAKSIICSIEQMGKEYNWEGSVKHTKAFELISQKTSLSEDDIFQIIKGTVGEFNLMKQR